jgi:phage-related protein
LVAQLATLLAQLVVALAPVIQWIAQLAAVILGQLTQGLAAMVTMVATTITAILGWFSNLVSAAPAWIGNMVNTISNWFSQLPGRVSGAVSSMVSSVTGFFSGLWSSVTSSVSTGISSVVSAFSGLGGKIMGALSGIAGDAYAAGSKIISSMADGVRSAGQAVIGAAQNVVQQVRDLLPFSPAKTGPLSGKGYPLYAGMAIGDSLAQGLNRSAAGVAGAMSSMLSPISGSVTVNGSAGGAGSGYGVPVVHVYIGDRELTDLVRVEVGGANSRTATALVGGAV